MCAHESTTLLPTIRDEYVHVCDACGETSTLTGPEIYVNLSQTGSMESLAAAVRAKFPKVMTVSEEG